MPARPPKSRHGNPLAGLALIFVATIAFWGTVWYLLAKAGLI